MERQPFALPEPHLGELTADPSRPRNGADDREGYERSGRKEGEGREEKDGTEGMGSMEKVAPSQILRSAYITDLLHDVLFMVLRIK